jgi:hypothetical protein
MYNVRAVLTAAVLGATLLASQGSAGTISGNVVDIFNHPVVSAAVMISEEPTVASKPPSLKGASTRAAADGTFSFTNLEAGTYLLCAQVPGGTLLNPCQWTTTPPQVTLNSTTATSSITLTMRPGYRLPIRVDDPQGLLSANEGKTPGAHLLVGVQGGYNFEAAQIDSTDIGGRNISVLVPFDASVSVMVQSRFFKLQDTAGNSINRAGAVPITASSAAPTAKFSIEVVGSN